MSPRAKLDVPAESGACSAGMTAAVVGVMLLFAGATPTLAQPAATGSAQAFPAKPIRLLTAEVGGGSDFTARLLSHRLTESLGQQIVIDNRTGGVIIGDIASKAQPDGYTLMLYSSSLWLMPYMRSHVPYSMSHFAPVSYISASPLILVVHPSVAAKSVEELIALAKAKPGDLNYASGPMGATPHLAGELFKSTNGLFAPAKTPPAVIERLNRETNSVLARPDIRDKFLAVGMELVGGTPAHFDQVIKADTARMSKVILAARIRAE